MSIARFLQCAFGYVFRSFGIKRHTAETDGGDEWRVADENKKKIDRIDRIDKIYKIVGFAQIL